MKVLGKIRGLGKFYADGTEQTEIHIKKQEGQGLPYQIGKKVPVQLLIGSRQYKGGIRSTERCTYIWISPTLIDPNKRRLTLAEALFKEGFIKNQEVFLEIENDKVKIMM